MTNDFHEKDFEDEVYEDDYYEEHYDEEELEEDDDLEEEDDDDRDDEVHVTISYACEECDYRWDDIIVKRKGNLEDEEEELEITCPMCGSMNVTQI